MPKPDFYYNIACPHARAALITLKHLKVDANLKEVELGANGTRLPSYLKINPTHTVPTFVDGDFELFESRAVVIYLASAYGANSGLYAAPNDFKAKANIDKVIFFDVTGFFPAIRKGFYAKLFKHTEPSEEELAELTDKTGILETILGEKKFFAGDHVTIADISVAVSQPYLKVLLPQFYSDKLKQWYERVVKAVPEVAEANGTAEADLIKRVDSFAAEHGKK